MVLYFTGTGNSRYVAQIIAKVMQDQLVSINSYVKENRKEALESEKPFIFVCPIYAWDIPRVVTEFVQNATFIGNKKAYFVVTCESDSGSADQHTKVLLEKKGLHYMGCATTYMPDNYIIMYKGPDPVKSVEKVQEATPGIFTLANQIKEEKVLPKQKQGFGAGFKRKVINPVFFSFFVKAKGYYATDSCTGCGACVLFCPLNNIKLKDGRPSWGNDCTQCMACICRCPKKAIEYKKSTKGKTRYYNKGYGNEDDIKCYSKRGSN